jgi:hypothetical protein
MEKADAENATSESKTNQTKVSCVLGEPLEVTKFALCNR